MIFAPSGPRRGQPPVTNAELVSRLMAKVRVQPSGCWEYEGKRQPFGHGLHSVAQRKRVLAHRLAWMLRYNDPGELCVLHKCDNPPCVNPKHLFLGTIADNNLDKKNKGRLNVEAAHEACRKIPKEQEKEICALFLAGTSAIELGKRYGVGRGAIYDVMKRNGS